MSQQIRKTTESGTTYYEVVFSAILANPMSEEDIKKIEYLLRELELKYYDAV